MQSTSLIEQELITEQGTQKTKRLKPLIGNFFTAGFAALAIYVFIVALPLWSLWEDGYYEFIDKIDPIAGAVIAIIGIGTAIRLKSQKLSQVEVEKYRYWMNTIIRYSLAYIFLVYGFAKVFGNQFTSLPFTLDTPLRDISGIQLTWRFFGYSYAYTLFIASSQIIGSILLFFRRTTTLAALMLLPIISNIVFLNFTHNIPVRLYSCFYLGMTVYLVLLDYRKLKAVFWDNRSFANQTISSFIRSHRLNLVKPLIVVLLLLGAIGDNYYATLLDKKLRSPLQGTWEVEEYRINDVAIEYDKEKSVWRKIYFEYTELAAIRTDQAKPHYVIPTIDTDHKTISLADRQSEEVFVAGSYELLSDRQMIMRVSNGKDMIQVTLQKIP
jgi:uncharacterized membrane protein YphA (DoxX/SURF4 family)